MRLAQPRPKAKNLYRVDKDGSELELVGVCEAEARQWACGLPQLLSS